MIKIFKLNSAAVKVILLMIMLTFFLPLIIISCEGEELAFSGLEITFGKRVDGLYLQDGNAFALILFVPALILLVLTFFVKRFGDTFLKNIFITAPIFNIIAAVTFRIGARLFILKKIADYLGDSYLYRGALAGSISVRAGWGLILYIILNAALFAAASINYFGKR